MESVDELIAIATRLRGRIEESKDRTRMLEGELMKIEDRIAAKIAQQRGEVISDVEVR